MSIHKALKWVGIWIGLALLFNLGVYVFLGSEPAVRFFGGYVIELSLSIDNLFVFLMIFTSFGLEAKHQRRVLNYGIAGAIVLRFLFIFAASSLIDQFDWLLYVFGAILIISGAKILLGEEKEKDYKDSKVIKAFSHVIPFTASLEGERFFIKRNKRLHATVLFAVVLIVEASDIIFAIDSIPAIFSVTKELEYTIRTFIIFTSNIFAILGLRSMYFLLERLSHIFRYMKYGVALVLVFTGVKLALPIFHIDIPILLSIGIIGFILVVSILASILPRKKSTGRGDN